MSKVIMLNLFRCSSSGDRMKEKTIHYFVADYFDGIKIEERELESTTLAECMGINGKANKVKSGISHQRYCLFAEDEQQDSIFKYDPEFPMLTVIQTFINSDIYQADYFIDTEDKKEVSCSNCIEKMKECIQNHLEQKNEIQWKVFRLLTAGDFAVIVRSKRIHDAYEISTLIRSVCMTPETDDRRETVFFTYSISGALHKNMDTEKEIIFEGIDWTNYLAATDRVLVRIVYTQAVNKENEGSQLCLADGYRLFGRYDYQIEYTPAEFQELYPYIRGYKFETVSISDEQLNSVSGEKVKILLEMIKQGHVLRINEKILLNYEHDPLLTGKQKYVWKVFCARNWMSLYDRNTKILSDIKNKYLDAIEQKLSEFYPSEHNLKEYVRLLGRLCRILYEINQMRELRISTANMSRQLEILLKSLYAFINNSKNNNRNLRTVARRIDEYLRLGIGALEIFARYIRNVNLQTLQTPNYDLQTNMCIEKLLLAYSQFLQPFLVKDKPEDTYHKGAYYLSNSCYPIIVPNMGVKDLSVYVLFNDYYNKNESLPTEASKKLMVVNSPTISFLCESCFMFPTAFHEVGHQVRYESQNERNDCLEAYLLKWFIYSMVIELLDREDQYGFEVEDGVEDVVDAVYQTLRGAIVSNEIKNESLQLFKLKFEQGIKDFLFSVKEKETPILAAKQYMKKTKEDVRLYNAAILEKIENIDKEIAKLEQNNPEENGNNYTTLFRLLDEYFQIQENQIFEEIIFNYNKNLELETEQSEALRDFCDATWKGMNVEEKGKKMFALWAALNNPVQDFGVWEELKDLLKHYHNLYNTYQETIYEKRQEQSKQEIYYQNVFKQMCSVMYHSLIKMILDLEAERNHHLSWETMPLKGEKLEKLKRKIKFEKEEGIEKRLKSIFSQYQESRITEFINSKMECYLEVTSDLFMCSMMGLKPFGYLVVAAENFMFNDESTLTLYNRISLVLQCLSKKREKTKLNMEDFSQELMEILCNELEMLQSKLPDISCEINMQTTSKIELDAIDSFIMKLQKDDNLTSTQQWVLRMLRQISYIIFNIKDVYLARDVIGEKEIWKDIVSDQSYIERPDMLSHILTDEVGTKLLKRIADILNSPASYFTEKKCILLEEINFVLSYYEKNCKEIFR